MLPQQAVHLPKPSSFTPNIRVPYALASCRLQDVIAQTPPHQSRLAGPHSSSAKRRFNSVFHRQTGRSLPLCRAVNLPPSDGEVPRLPEGCLTGTPAEVSERLAQLFIVVLGMNNGCVPASLLLHEILTLSGKPSSLVNGYVVIGFANSAQAATAHMWVEAGGDILDIGWQMTEMTGAAMPKGLTRELAYAVPPGVARPDLDDPEFAFARQVEELCNALRSSDNDQLLLRYWSEAPLPLQKFRTEMLHAFVPPRP